MAWDRSAGTHPKYRSAEHKRERARLVAQLKRDGVLWCTAVVCLMPSRAITNPNGREPDGLHLGHEDDGATIRGPEHGRCNTHDGAVRGRARQDPPRRWEL